jgi:hypothetical protein
MSSEAVDSSWGDLSGQREIFSYSNCHFYHDTSFPDGSRDGAAQIGRDAHPYDLTCSLALLNPYRGGRQQLMLVPCAAAEAAADSGAAWIAEACIIKTSSSGSCDGAARAECNALGCSLLWSFVSLKPVPDRRLLHLWIDSGAAMGGVSDSSRQWSCGGCSTLAYSSPVACLRLPWKSSHKLPRGVTPVQLVCPW